MLHTFCDVAVLVAFFCRDQVVLDPPNCWTSIEQGNHNNKLVDDLGVDLEAHSWCDLFVVFSEFTVMHRVVLRSFSCQTDGTKNVHKEVNPKELHNCKRTCTYCSRSDEHDHNTGDVAGELEL